MVLTENQTIELKGAIASALARVYIKDLSLIKRHTHERSIVFRFGLYFSDIIAQTSFGIDNELILDFDYNRNLNRPKRLEGFGDRHGVFPDIIFHKRESNLKNVLVIEFKGHWTALAQDDIKLKGFTSIEKGYHFGLGVFIVLSNELVNCQTTYYKNGALEQNIESH